MLAGEEMAKMRRWTYGVEEAPDDFICRTCVSGVRRPCRRWSLAPRPCRGARRGMAATMSGSGGMAAALHHSREVK
ncbi:MAG TPA: hypothetical protein VJ901_01035 [Thermoanaerobaculia bacterium]|nr:hypothetical protein [Thermoanaerobaculia bacterium]